MTRDHTDVLIIGGGLAGAALALLLRRARELSVTLVEAAPLPPPNVTPFTPSFDARSTALSAGTLEILATLGIVAPLLEQAADIDLVHVSRRGRPGCARICAAEEGLERLGAVVENRWLGRVLLNAVHADAGIRLLAPARPERIRRTLQGYEVELEDGGRLACTLLVAADGARSRTRDALGIGARHDDTGHDAMIANVALTQPHRGQAFERFVDDGPLALLPMTANRCALIWTGPRNVVDDLYGLDDARLLARLQDQFGDRLGPLAAIGKRDRYPLILTSSHAQAIPHAVVVGNAAHTLHPVAGQGFNLTLRDLKTLADTLADAEEIGALAVLQRWAESREADQALIGRVSRWLPELFRTRFGPVSHVRQLGLIAFDLLPGARSAFARKAMGFANGL